MMAIQLGSVARYMYVAGKSCQTSMEIPGPRDEVVPMNAKACTPEDIRRIRSMARFEGTLFVIIAPLMAGGPESAFSGYVGEIGSPVFLVPCARCRKKLAIGIFTDPEPDPARARCRACLFG